MMSYIIQTLRWCISVGAKFARVVPLQTIFIVCVTLISQVSALLASFLPLKVVILLGSERIPRYFPDSWVGLDRDFLIGVLCLGTLGFYLLHLFTERLIRIITAWGARRLLQRSHKMALFDNQDDVAEYAYLRFSRALASGVFIILALTGLGYFYPAMALVLFGYVFFFGLFLCLLYMVSKGFRNKLESNLSGVLATVAGLGFFVAFGYLVTDFILWAPPAMIVGIVALLLSRQIMQRIAAMVGDLSNLKRQQTKLDALFFHGKVFFPSLSGEKGEFWNLLVPSDRHEWLVPLMLEFTSWQGGELNTQWQQSGVVNVAFLIVKTEIGRFLVKLYDSNRGTFAQHELTLMLEAVPGLPGLPFLGAKQVARLHCLLYAMPEGDFASICAGKKMQKTLLASLLRVQPGDALTRRYLRSRPMLWQRLRSPMLQRMQVAIVEASQQQRQVDRLLESLPQLTNLLRDLPVWIFTIDIGPAHIYQCAAPGPMLLNWNRWSMEPVGAGWPVARLDDLGKVLEQVRLERKDLVGVCLGHLELAAMCAALEVACNTQRYSDALSVLPDLLARLDSLVQ